MRIYGELIGKLTATSENGLALLDRTLEVYITKRKVKFYLFASNIKGWHKETKIIKKMEVTFEHLHFLETIINEGVKYMEQTYNLTFSGCIKYNNVYRIFFVEINGSTIGIAEEKLENYINQCIENGHYEEVCDIDSKYLYYVPQEIADTENENEIIESIKDVLI